MNKLDTATGRYAEEPLYEMAMAINDLIDSVETIMDSEALNRGKYSIQELLAEEEAWPPITPEEIEEAKLRDLADLAPKEKETK